MSSTLIINIKDSEGTSRDAYEGPVTAKVKWSSGKIGTIVIEDFRLGTKYKTRHGSSPGMNVALETLEEPRIEVRVPKSYILEVKEFHLIPDGKGGFEVWS